MNDEIKEILRNCEKAINEASGYNDTTDKIIDFITNLQQENEKLKKNYERLTEDYVKKEYIVKAIENIFNEVKGDDTNE